MYESPVKLYMTDVQSQLIKQQEEMILKAVQSVAVGVDHEELFRALRYDRDQYSKGYRDAKNEIVRCKDCGWWHRHKSGDTSRGVCDKYAMSKNENGFCDEPLLEERVYPWKK